MLAKHGLVVWGDSAEEAYEQTIEVINRAAELVNARTTHGVALRRPERGARGLDEDARSRHCCTMLPALRGAVSSERPKVLIVDVSPAALSSSTRATPPTVEVGAACPDHLVHTKRLRCGFRSTRRPTTVAELTGRIPERRRRLSRRVPAYFERNADATPMPADPDPRVMLIQNVGLVAAGTTARAAGSRAISTTARSR